MEGIVQIQNTLPMIKMFECIASFTRITEAVGLLENSLRVTTPAFTPLDMVAKGLGGRRILRVEISLDSLLAPTTHTLKENVATVRLARLSGFSLDRGFGTEEGIDTCSPFGFEAS